MIFLVEIMKLILKKLKTEEILKQNKYNYDSFFSYINADNTDKIKKQVSYDLYLNLKHTINILKKEKDSEINYPDLIEDEDFINKYSIHFENFGIENRDNFFGGYKLRIKKVIRKY